MENIPSRKVTFRWAKGSTELCRICFSLCPGWSWDGAAALSTAQLFLQDLFLSKLVDFKTYFLAVVEVLIVAVYFWEWCLPSGAARSSLRCWILLPLLCPSESPVPRGHNAKSTQVVPNIVLKCFRYLIGISSPGAFHCPSGLCFLIRFVLGDVLMTVNDGHGDGEDEITSRSWVILGIQGKGMKSNTECTRELSWAEPNLELIPWKCWEMRKTFGSRITPSCPAETGQF